MGARAPLVSVREYRLRPYQVTFREFGDRTTSRGCARRQSTYTERVDRRGSRPGARGQHMGGGGWSRADPMAHKRTRARFFRSGRRRRAHPPPPHVRGAPRSTSTSAGRLTLTPSQHRRALRRGRACTRARPRSSTRPCTGSPAPTTGYHDDHSRGRPPSVHHSVAHLRGGAAGLILSSAQTTSQNAATRSEITAGLDPNCVNVSLRVYSRYPCRSTLISRGARLRSRSY